MPPIDAIVIGLGAVGSAAAYQIARRGGRVLGIDRFSPPHAFGSSHGDTRITRVAIGEGRHYVPLVQRSHEIWRELEQATGQELLVETGGVFFAGQAQGAPVHGAADFIGETIAAARAFGIPLEELSAAELARRFPQFRLHGRERGVYEPSAGFVRPERCLAAQLELAARLGAELRRDETVHAVRRRAPGEIEVETERGRFTAARVILTAGSWVRHFLPASHAPHFRVYRQLLFWFPVAGDLTDFAPGRFPIFIRTDHRKDEVIYGFPAVDGPDGGIKIATEQYAETCTPEAGTRPVTREETDAMLRFAEQHLPVRAPCLRATACLFTVTPDGGFVIDEHPEHPEVLIASACSGHGFKHSAAVGEMLAELALEGRTRFDRAPFALARFGAAPCP